MRDQFEEIDDQDDDLDEYQEGGMEVVYVGQHNPEAGEEPEERVYAVRPNKSAQKREMVALQKLADRLLTFSEQRLAPLGLSERTTQALAEGRRIKALDARRRQQRFLAKLLSGEELEPVDRFLEAIDGRNAASNRHFHELELWRDRLIDEGDEALEGLLEEQPQADRQQLRQLIRAAKRERELERPPAAARKLFKFLRALFEQDQ
ncbi:MAG: DUF615 domain-containing protein [Gammaproteobacteria bacterium]|nr:DUF615 domain-containing protein [Gammaproteobacteria bacterium]MBU1655133.1 DUF615 domain-containing protein [Gammaproteobacteria bacterium]MBU1962099.1 DUF615 domain-containing protein [Gammaproteobacteria bacterium]